MLFSIALGCAIAPQITKAQHHALTQNHSTKFTHADTLRGSDTKERQWWDVTYYELTIHPDYNSKSIKGKNIISFNAKEPIENAIMQIDLQEPLTIDSIFNQKHRKLNYTREKNVFHVETENIQAKDNQVIIYYHGVPREAKRAPWDGGWIWTKDSLNRPWMTVAVQGLGASAWYPCKDYQGDEPNNGAKMHIIIPDSLEAVSNGNFISSKAWDKGNKIVTWAVKNPINNYDFVPYIGKYVKYEENYKGEGGNLHVSIWPLDYNLAKAKSHSLPNVHHMLKAFEHWFGPYPFYEDGYKLVDAPHLGMEHQSAVAYGNHYLNGYLGRDLSQTGEGLKWDFIIVHESGHEWFGNNITSKDIADMWIHESFTNYSETLFTEYFYGIEAGQIYCNGIRKNIQNDKPIIGPYGVNVEGSGDMYYKGANMINNIRHAIDNDAKFRNILTGMNKTFHVKTVTAKDIEEYINTQSGIDFNSTFKQYLTTTQIPEFRFTIEGNKVLYKYSNCNDDFDMPMVLHGKDATIKLHPTTEWQSIVVNKNQIDLFNPIDIEFQYYVNAIKGK